jgi:nucleoid DNA-binding protein
MWNQNISTPKVLTRRLSKRTRLPEEIIRVVLDALAEDVGNSLVAGKGVSIRHLARFHVVKFKARTVGNPNDPSKPNHVPDTLSVRCKAARYLKERVKNE